MILRSILIYVLLIVGFQGASAETLKLSLTHFTDTNGKEPAGGWSTDSDGALHLKGKGGNLISKLNCTNFILEWEWKVAAGANNGIKYWVTNVDGKGDWLGIEYQMIDDDKHPDGLRGGSHTTASFYDIQEPEPGKPVRPAGEWNSSRIVVKNGRLEHWLNGKRVGNADTNSEDWKRRVAASKFKNKSGFASGAGRIMLTDHQDETWFRSLRLTLTQ